MIKKVAYLILCHTDEKQLIRLVNSLDYKCDFYIHIDAKADIDKFQGALIGRENVYFTRDRYKVSWAGFNMILATKELMKAALEKQEPYSHLVLLSGMDYPIKSKKYIHNFLVSKRDTQFIRGFDIAKANSKHYLKQIQKYWFYDMPSNSNIFKGIREAFHYICLPLTKATEISLANGERLAPCFGSQWWALTPSCANYVLQYSATHKEIDRYFKHSFSPDEKYIQTIVLNSSFSNSTTAVGAEGFKEAEHSMLSNLHIIDSSLSKYFNEEDFNEVIESDKLFVRKVSTKVSTKLLNRIDNYIE